eukprot:11002072-Alexandrium_andersonii.AAC.1
MTGCSKRAYSCCKRVGKLARGSCVPRGRGNGMPNSCELPAVSWPGFACCPKLPCQSPIHMLLLARGALELRGIWLIAA